MAAVVNKDKPPSERLSETRLRNALEQSKAFVELRGGDKIIGLKNRVTANGDPIPHQVRLWCLAQDEALFAGARSADLWALAPRIRRLLDKMPSDKGRHPKL